jgi:hypothetical protein
VAILLFLTGPSMCSFCRDKSCYTLLSLSAHCLPNAIVSVCSMLVAIESWPQKQKGSKNRFASCSHLILVENKTLQNMCLIHNIIHPCTKYHIDLMHWQKVINVSISDRVVYIS